jgi:hypothetical protein
VDIHPASSSRSAFASFRSAVSKPSVNQPVDVGEHRARFVAATLFREEPGEARGRSQFRYSHFAGGRFRLPRGNIAPPNEASHALSRLGGFTSPSPSPACSGITYLLNRMTHSPPSPQTLRNLIHDAQPMPAPAPAPQPHRDRVTLRRAQLREGKNNDGHYA